MIRAGTWTTRIVLMIGALLSIVLALMALTRTPRTPGLPSPAGSHASLGEVLPPQLAGAKADTFGTVVTRVLAAGSPGYGMLLYSAFIYRLTGDPFMWTRQNIAWGRVYRSLDSIVSDRVDFITNNGLYTYASTQTLDMFYLMAVVLCLAAVWPVYRRYGVALAALIPITILPPMAAGGLLSMGRVTAVLFPVFLWLGAAIPAQHRHAWVGLFALLQGFVAVMFFTWRPLF